MKRFTAMLLALVLVLSSAACRKNEEPSGGAFGSSEVPETTAAATSIEETTAEPAVDKQAYYEELFQKGGLKTAGDSVQVIQKQGEGTVDIRYESAGNDSSMLMKSEATGLGFGVFSVNGTRYLYGKLKDSAAGEISERLLVIEDPSFSMGDDKPNINLDLTGAEYEVEYLSTHDGVDDVRLIVPADEQVMDLSFNEAGRVAAIAAGSEGAGTYRMTFYEVEKIEFPSSVSPEKVSEEVFSAFAMACLFSIMGENGGFESGIDEPATTEQETSVPETSIPETSQTSVQDMFLAERDLQIDYEGDSGIYTFDRLPKTSLDMTGLIECCGLWTPYEAAAFYIVALHAYEEDPDVCNQMVRQLMVPETTDAGYQFIYGQLKEKPYLCDIYFSGVDLKTKKAPDAPYVIRVSKTTGADAGYTYVKVWTDAVEGERTIVLQQIGKNYYVVKCPSLLLSLGDKPY